MKGGKKRSHREGTESNREGREGGSNRKGRYSERTVSIASHCTFFKVTSSQTCSCCMNPMTSNIISAATILFCLLKRHCSIPCCTQGLNNHNMYMYTSHQNVEILKCCTCHYEYVRCALRVLTRSRYRRSSRIDLIGSVPPHPNQPLSLAPHYHAPLHIYSALT